MPDLLNTVKEELGTIKRKLNIAGLSSAVTAELNRHQEALEAWYKQLLAKGGLISAEEETEVKEALLDSKKTGLEQSSRRTKLIFTGVLVVSILSVAVIIYVKKSKS